MNISVVIPLLNEDESLKELHDWIAKVMQSNRFLYEIVFIDDGSTDNSWQVIEELAKQNTSVKGIKFQKNYGKSQALNAGFLEAKGDVVITMDADLQDDPDEIPELLARLEIAFERRPDGVIGVLVWSLRCGLLWNQSFE